MRRRNVYTISCFSVYVCFILRVFSAHVARRRSEKSETDGADVVDSTSELKPTDILGDNSQSLSSSRKDLSGSTTSISSVKSQTTAAAISPTAPAPASVTASPKPRLTFRAASQATLTFICARRRVKDWANKKINQHKKASPEDLPEGSLGVARSRV